MEMDDYEFVNKIIRQVEKKYYIISQSGKKLEEKEKEDE